MYFSLNIGVKHFSTPFLSGTEGEGMVSHLEKHHASCWVDNGSGWESGAVPSPQSPIAILAQGRQGPPPRLPFPFLRRVLEVHAGRWGPAPLKQLSGRPAGHHGGPEACAPLPGRLKGPERRPWGARVLRLSPVPWPGPSLPE